LSAHNSAAGIAFGLLVIAALFTSFYSWRLIFMTFHGKPRASADVMHHAHESPPVMLVPLFVLAVGALLAGVVFKDFFFGDHYENSGRALCSPAPTTRSWRNSTMFRCGSS
jgi:NADH-quinone oxidoreductase subunit L